MKPSCYALLNTNRNENYYHSFETAVNMRVRQQVLSGW